MFKFIENIIKFKKKPKKETIMYPYCYVFYKTEDSIGWNMAIMDGDEDEVHKKCSVNNWYNFEIFGGSKCAWHVEDKIKYYMRPSDVHLISHWIYWQELDRWFINEDEIIPYPQKPCEETKEIIFTYSLSETDDNWNDPDDFDKEEEVYVSAEVDIKTDIQCVKTIVKITALYDQLEKFINNLKVSKFAVLHLFEFNDDKYIAWEKDNNIRFIVQDYSDDENEYIPIKLDVLVNKDIFYDNFENFYSGLKTDSENLKQEMINFVRNKK